MARIQLTPGTVVTKQLLQLNTLLIQASQVCARLKAVLDQMSAAGTTPTNLETDTDALIPTGKGAAVYTQVAAIQTALSGISTSLSVLDRG